MIKWSKLKQQVESLLAEPLQGRVQYHITMYKMSAGHYEGHGRGWITFDGQEVWNFSEIEWEVAYYRLASQLRAISGTIDYRNPTHKEGYYLAEEEAKQILLKKGIYSQGHFVDALFESVRQPMATLLQSEDPIVRAISMLDRRVGKRRLQNMVFEGNTNDLAKTLYQIRCGVANL